MSHFIQMGLFLILFIAIVTGCNRSNEEVIYHSDYPSYDTLSELEDNSDLIIRGTIVHSSVEVLDVSGPPLPAEELANEQLNPHSEGERPEEEPLELVFTVSDVEIEEIYKGEFAGDVIQVKQGGGKINDVLHIEHGVKMVEDSQTYILFLRTFDFVPASLLNPYQAAYVYTDGDIQPHHPDHQLSIEEELIIQNQYANE